MKTRNQAKYTVGDFNTAMEQIAPSSLAQSWDNVGVIAGDLSARIRGVLLCIDLTAAVIEEAVTKGCDLVMAYHPPIFKPIHALKVPSHGTDWLVFHCIQQGIAIYSTHTALDAADGGTNDVLARLAGVEQTEPLEYVDAPGVRELKLVTFVPTEALEQVSTALFEAGAGRIGEYSHCSYRIQGQGTFVGGPTTNPTIGRRGRLEVVDEVRLESVVAPGDLPKVVAALREAHPYEEPAFDIYPLQAKPVRGIGRVGNLPRAMKLGELARLLQGAAQTASLQVVGTLKREIDRAIVVAGAAGSLPFKTPLRRGDVIITGEIRHHDALTIERHDAAVIALGHWASERPVLPSLAKRLSRALPGLAVTVSKADHDPIQTMGAQPKGTHRDSREASGKSSNHPNRE